MSSRLENASGYACCMYAWIVLGERGLSSSLLGVTLPREIACVSICKWWYREVGIGRVNRPIADAPGLRSLSLASIGTFLTGLWRTTCMYPKQSISRQSKSDVTLLDAEARSHDC